MGNNGLNSGYIGTDQRRTQVGSYDSRKHYLERIGGQFGTSWTPAQITTALWLDAADNNTITLNGSTVSQWNDKSGNVRNVSQASSTSQPTYNATGFNNQPTIDFDGLNDFLKNASYQPAGALSCFVVFNRDTTGGVFVNIQRSGGIFEINGGGGAGYTNITVTGTGNLNPALGFDISGGGTSTNIILYITYDGSGTLASDFSARVNGTDNTIVNSGAVGYLAETGITIGARAVQNIGFYNGRISEIVLIEGQISQDNRDKIEGYLAWKWGLQANLPSNHPYKNAAPIV